LGDTNSRSQPTQIGGDTDWKMVAGGNAHTIAVKTDGTIYAWGLNTFGQLGDDTAASKSSPVLIGGPAIWHIVAAGPEHSMGITQNGQLYAWGRNGNVGQLGQNNIINRSSPVQVGTFTNWSNVACASIATAAIEF
jgi:alpha-tubulin suppressor-like RCC1 family protein